MSRAKGKDLVLIVEDSEYMRKYLSALLDKVYEVKTAEDGEEGFKMALKYLPSLVLTDILMPKLDGFGLLEKLRKNKTTKNVPVILLTGHADQQSIIKGIEMGADDCITKPVVEKELLARVKNYLELFRSRQKELKDELRHEKKINRQKDDFIEIVGHELRTPLTCLSGYIQLLDSMIEKHDSIKHEYVKRSKDQIGVLKTLVNDLLNITKMQTGQLEYNFVKSEAYRFVELTLKKIQHNFPSHQLIMNGSGKAMILVDQKRLQQVLVNYISNAVKYSPDSESVEVEIINNDFEVEVCIKDTGIGIPEDQMKHLSKKFYRVDHKNVSGLGLGLYICSEIIKMHKGETWAESVQGEGSIFCFSLPVIKNTRQ